MKKSLLASLFAAAAMMAQPPVPPPAPPAPPAPPDPPPAPMMVEFLRTETANFSNKSVKGIPYAAEGVNETTQVLADGNRITRKSTSSVYRDSQGRTRNEHSLGDVGPWASKGEKIVNIFDPVARVNITLHPDKTAMKLQMPPMGEGNVRFMQSNSGNTMIFERRVEGPKVVRGMESGVVSADRIEKDIIIERAPGVTPGPHTAGFVTVHDAMSEKRSFRTESLGKKVIEGVEAEGTRNVTTIAAGEIGNERPIEIIDETWYSKELEALVYSRHADPRTGETSYRLTNIRRGEQPMDLFEVPVDYKVHEGPGKVEMKIRTRKPE